MLPQDLTHALTGKAVLALADALSQSNGSIAISVHNYNLERYNKLEAVEQVYDKYTRWKTIQVTKQVRFTYFPANT